MDQQRSESPRYEELEEEFQDVGRSVLIFGLHVHIGVEDRELSISLLNQLRTWLPHLLALSSNSPFWLARYTGLRSYRAIVWKRFLRTGVPDPLHSWSDFENYVKTLVKSGCIDNGKKVWWDIRPHAFYSTIEFRIFDMPATFEDTIALSALCQTLVARLAWLHRHGLMTPILSRCLIEENKWRAARYGLDAIIILDADSNERLVTDDVPDLLTRLEPVAKSLHCADELAAVSDICRLGASYQRQRQVAEEHDGDLRAVVDALVDELNF
jgi:carboxylate-amine ligase